MTGGTANIAGKVVAITGASSGLGEASARHLSEHGADVTEPTQVQALVDLAVETYGRVDVLLNNAGIMPHSPLERRKIEDWSRTIDAVYAAAKTAVRVISEGLRQEVKAWNLRTTIISPGAVATELPTSITEADVAHGIGQFYSSRRSRPTPSRAPSPSRSASRTTWTSTRFSSGPHGRNCESNPMTRLTRALATLAVLAPMSTDAQTIAISRGGSREVRTAPAANFTGSVRVEMLFEPVEPSPASGGYVTFEPRARTAWQTHPRGQVLIVTAGVGRVQQWGGAIAEIRAGDVVRIPAGQKHWHGASPQSAMTHLAVSEHRDGTAVEWMEPVTDEQYNAAVAAQPDGTRPSGPRQQALAPGLAALTDDVLYGDVWRRPDLSPRDRSLVTISALIATGKTAQLAGHLGRGLDNGIQPREASGLLAHLAVYSGWPNVVSALEIYEQVYTARNIDTAALRSTGPRLPAPASDASRAKDATDQWGAVAPKFVALTNAVVFDDLWRRSDLAPRDRALVTLAALAATGDDDQLELYVRRGLDSGLTREQIAEGITHVAFYAGWGRASAAMTAVARVLAR